MIWFFDRLSSLNIYPNSLVFHIILDSFAVYTIQYIIAVYIFSTHTTKDHSSPIGSQLEVRDGLWLLNEKFCSFFKFCGPLLPVLKKDELVLDSR